MKVVTQEFVAEMPLATLEAHPDNPRKGDTKAVDESIQANGFYGAILVQKSTNRVLAGHTRLRALIEQGAETVPAMVLDVDDAQARKILLADNRTSDLAFYDDDALFRVLSDILDDGGTLAGTGYDDMTYKLLTRAGADEDLYVGNVQQNPSAGERISAFEGSDLHSIILPYPTEDYEVVVAGLGRLRTELGFKSNAEVVLHLVQEAGE